jgi:hypothetical protein
LNPGRGEALRPVASSTGLPQKKVDHLKVCLDVTELTNVRVAATKPARTRSMLPTQLQVDDRGEWEVVTRPATLLGGKTVRTRVQKVGEPTVTRSGGGSGALTRRLAVSAGGRNVLDQDRR